MLSSRSSKANFDWIVAAEQTLPLVRATKEAKKMLGANIVTDNTVAVKHGAVILLLW